MSTRCSINFGYGPTEVDAKVYRHSDGYPGRLARGEAKEKYGVLVDLQTFFAEVERQTKDTRFSDPNYLAAKFVVWQAAKNAAIAREFGGPQEPVTDPVGDLRFLGVGVLMTDPGDLEYTYYVDCHQMDEKGRPIVRWRRVRYGKGPDGKLYEPGEHEVPDEE